MPTQVPLPNDALAEEISRGSLKEVRPDIAYRRVAIANVVFLGDRSKWVLVDAGLFGSASFIRSSAKERFGDTAPAAIVLTHGHFDHVGALVTLADEWDVPVYAHALEHPYLDGSASYPPPDPAVGGGIMSWSSALYPRGPVNVRRRLRTLPSDAVVPHLPGWKWIHTPGHSPGHVSLWREADRALIAGDAIITTRQESAYAVFTQKPELHGPPMYYTPDWASAEKSAHVLASLKPDLLLSGHGPPLSGPLLHDALTELTGNFMEIAAPERGHYVAHPATVEDGSAYRRIRKA